VWCCGNAGTSTRVQFEGLYVHGPARPPVGGSPNLDLSHVNRRGVASCLSRHDRGDLNHTRDAGGRSFRCPSPVPAAAAPCGLTASSPAHLLRLGRTRPTGRGRSPGQRAHNETVTREPPGGWPRRAGQAAGLTQT
jgi:hypothetical protein